MKIMRNAERLCLGLILVAVAGLTLAYFDLKKQVGELSVVPETPTSSSAQASPPAAPIADRTSSQLATHVGEEEAKWAELSQWRTELTSILLTLAEFRNKTNSRLADLEDQSPVLGAPDIEDMNDCLIAIYKRITAITIGTPTSLSNSVADSAVRRECSNLR